MCFSAPVSFGTAAILGVTGIATMTKARGRADLPLAAVPLVFALQQALEGALWLTVPQGRAHSIVFANLFAAIALVVWPLLSPAAAALVERDMPRRLLMLTLLPAGIGAAIYSAGTMLAHPYLAWPEGHALKYVNNHAFSPTMIVTYMVCTSLPPLLSSSRILRMFGIVVLTGLAVAMAAFFESFFSVWCFFAALASLLVLGFFRDRARSPGIAAIEAQHPAMSD